MSQGRQDVMDESKKKGFVAGVATAGSVALGALVAWPLGVAAAVPAAYFGYKWWKHRAENGIRF